MFDELEKELGNIVSAFDLQEMVKRLVKYLVEGAAVTAAVYYIPKRSLDWEEIVTIAITAAATFCVLDVVTIQAWCRNSSRIQVSVSVLLSWISKINSLHLLNKPFS